MTNSQKNGQRSGKGALFFPMSIINKASSSISYLFRSLTLSMRRRIAFDYLVMYVLVSFLTLVVFAIGFNGVRTGEKARDIYDQLLPITRLYQSQVIERDVYETQLAVVAEDNQVGLYIEMSKDETKITFLEGSYEEKIYAARYIENIVLFFVDGTVKRTFMSDRLESQGLTMPVKIQIAQPFMVPSAKLVSYSLFIMISQVIGIAIITFIGSHRLKKTFFPIYLMTKTADKLTLQDMNVKLDVSRAEYELKDLARTFNEMIERIRDDYVKQKRFVSDVSHELRTPIAIINGYARMLDRWGKEDPQVLEEAIDAIKGESKNMQVLVENLLTLVRSDNQTLMFEKEHFDISTMAGDILKDMEMIDEGQHIFEKDIEESVMVCLDYAKVKQTFRIFLDNAIKYTQKDGIIGVRIKKYQKNVIITIYDTGIGVSKEDLPHLFERFYRSDDSRTRETGGHGLGLAIAKAMIIGQDGRIRVKSKEGEGSSFIIEMPVICDEEMAKERMKKGI